MFELHGNAATSTCMMCKETIPTLDAMVQFQEDEVCCTFYELLVTVAISALLIAH